jgi:hypothetical protein
LSVAFDTLKLADRLAAGGFTTEQSRTAASALSEAFTADLVTKDMFRVEIADVRNEIADVRNEIDLLRQEMKAEIANAKADMVKWLVGTIGFQAVVIIGAVTTLLKIFIK